MNQLLLVQDEAPKEIKVASGLIAVIGNSGSGKSTLFRLLESALLSERTISSREGEKNPPKRPTWYVADNLVQEGGQPLLSTPQDNARVHPTLTTIGNVLHFLATLPWCTAHRPSVLAAVEAGDLADPETRARAALRVVGLEDRADLRAGSLSGGEKRRLLLAMDLALGPKVLVADEPLSQLDSGSATRVFEALLQQSKDGPVLFTVHQPIDEWLERCDQVWVVERPSTVAVAVAGKDFVRVADELHLEQDSTLENTLMDIPNPNKMTLVEVVEAVRNVKGGEGGQPAAYRVLARMKDPAKRGPTVNALRTQMILRPPPEVPATERPPVQERPASGRWLHSISHEISDQFIGNLRSGLYWVMLGLFIGVTFFTNFFGGADSLPFALPLATNALLVSILFVSTVSGVRVWAGPVASRIRELYIRGANLPALLAGKAAPAILEALLIAALALIGTWTLELRGAAPGWPDAFASIPWLDSVPAVVILMVFVGLTGWAQGATISLLMAVFAQGGALKHFSDPRAEKDKERKQEKAPAMGMDPVQQAYSLAVLLVVGQIGLGGAFGQITSDYDDIVSDGATLVVDTLGSLSPLRWGYNAALISEWRQTRCRVRQFVDQECDSLIPKPKISNECIPGGIADDTFTPSTAHWIDINDPACGRSATQTPTDGTLEPERRNTVALYFQAGDEEADRLDRLLERQSLLAERKVLLPPQAASEAFSAQSFAKLNEVRKDPAAKNLACFQREANVDYLYSLTETLVAKGMIRPELVDVQWCWRNCPDVREVKGRWEGGRVTPSSGEFMLKDCPAPGSAGADEAMKNFYRPAVSLLDGSTDYPCQTSAHDLFVDQARFQEELNGLCDARKLLPAEENLLFWMLVVAFGWGGAALLLALMWSRRVARGA